MKLHEIMSLVAISLIISFPPSEIGGPVRAFLGIEFSTLSKEKARLLGFENPYGSYIEKVLKNSTADHAGLQPFDYIFGVDEYRVGASQDLGQILDHFKIGDQATIYLIRRGSLQSVPVTFVSRHEVEEIPKDPCNESFLGVQLSMQAPSRIGVRVNIVANSTAKAMGLRDGDVVVTINGHLMIDWDDIRIAIDNAVVGNPVTITYTRDGQEESSVEKLKSYCETIIKEELQYTPARPETLSFSITEVHPLFIQEVNAELDLDLPEVNNLNIESIQLSSDEEGPRLHFRLPEAGKTNIKIFTDSGRLVYDYELVGYRDSFEELIDVFRFDRLYYLVIWQGDLARVYSISVN